MRLCSTFDDVVDALGGRPAIIRLTKAKGIGTWRKRKAFPPRYYFVLKLALADRGYYPELSLFAFYNELGKTA
jgi:hypothetical protein